METMEDHLQEQWEDLAVGAGDLKITVHQGVGADTLEEEAALTRFKPEGKVARIVVVPVVGVHLPATQMMMAWFK